MQQIWLMSLNLSKLFILPPTSCCLFFLFHTRAATKTPAQMKKAFVSTFTPSPFVNSALFLVKKIYMLLFPPPKIFYVETVLSWRPSSSLLLLSPCTNTADRSWRSCHDTVACRLTNPSQSGVLQALRGTVCLFCPRFRSVLICVFNGLCNWVKIDLCSSLHVVSVSTFLHSSFVNLLWLNWRLFYKQIRYIF